MSTWQPNQEHSHRRLASQGLEGDMHDHQPNAGEDRVHVLVQRGRVSVPDVFSLYYESLIRVFLGALSGRQRFLSFFYTNLQNMAIFGFRLIVLAVFIAHAIQASPISCEYSTIQVQLHGRY